MGEATTFKRVKRQRQYVTMQQREYSENIEFFKTFVLNAQCSMQSESVLVAINEYK